MNIEKYIHRYKIISFRVRAISLSFLFTFLSCVFIFLSVFFHFLPCSFQFHQSYLCFTFILLKFPSFPFVPSCPSDVPLISLSVCLFSFRLSHFPSHLPFMSLVTSVSFPFSLQVIPFSLYVLSFLKIISNFRAYSFQIMFMVLGSFHDLPCPFMLLFSSLLLPTFYLYVDGRHNKCAG